MKYREYFVTWISNNSRISENSKTSLKWILLNLHIPNKDKIILSVENPTSTIKNYFLKEEITKMWKFSHFFTSQMALAFQDNYSHGYVWLLNLIMSILRSGISECWHLSFLAVIIYTLKFLMYNWSSSSLTLSICLRSACLLNAVLLFITTFTLLTKHF